MPSPATRFLWALVATALAAAALAARPFPTPGQHRIEYLAALAEKVQRHLRGAPKSGTTFTTVLVHNAMRAVAEAVYYGAADSLEWNQFPSHEVLACGPHIDETTEIHVNQASLCASGLVPGFGHGANVGREEYCRDYKAGSKPDGFPTGTKNMRSVMLVRHPLDLLYAQHRWYNSTGIPFVPGHSFSIHLLRCVLNYYTAVSALIKEDPDVAMIVRYEDLLSNENNLLAAKTLRKMLEFWRLPWTGGSIATALETSSRQAMFQLESTFRRSEEQSDDKWRYTHKTEHLLLLDDHPADIWEELRQVLASTPFAADYGYSIAACAPACEHVVASVVSYR